MNKLYIMDADDCLAQLSENSIQMIYIDPPYNTKSKFEYHDSFDDWESFISKKIERSRLILKESGIIFISIDDNKLIELRQICNKYFGKEQFLGMFITRQATRSNAKHINIIHEYIVAYAKNKKQTPKFEVRRLDIPFYAERLSPLLTEIKRIFNEQGQEKASDYLKEKNKLLSKEENFSWFKNYSIVDENGDICFATDLSTPGSPAPLSIPEIGLNLPALPSRSWSSKEKFIKLFNDKKIIFKQGRPYEKHLLTESYDNAMSILNFYSRQGKHDLEKLHLGDIFSTAKPVEMIKYLIKIAQTKDEDIILDYFAGSGTTAQAVLECNKEDGQNRHFILCQIDEPIKNKEKPKKILLQAGLKPTIANITRLRLIRLQSKIPFSFQEITNY